MEELPRDNLKDPKFFERAQGIVGQAAAREVASNLGEVQAIDPQMLERRKIGILEIKED